MNSLTISLLFGVAVALAIWPVRALFLMRRQLDEAWLKQAVWQFTPEPFNPRNYLHAWYLFALVVFLLGLVFFPTPLVSAVITALILIVPRFIVDYAWGRRLVHIDEQLPIVISIMASSVQAGLSLVQAIERLARTAPEPIRTEFKIMANSFRHGADFEDIILEAKRRLNLPNFNLFASVMLINREVGGNVGDTLNNISQSLESVQDMREKMKSATSAGRANIKILSVAPFVFLALMSIVEYEGVVMMFTTVPGWIILAVASGLSAAGGYWGWKLMNAEV